MEMCYDGALVMPSSYAVMEQEEMTYVEGGVSLKVKKSYLNKNTCLSVASKYTAKTGLGKTRIAKEIYAHAVMYYASPWVLGSYAVTVGSVMGGAVGVAAVLGALKYIRSHANPIDLGGDSAFRVKVYNAIWKCSF